MGLPAPADGQGPGYFGVYPALVTDMVDDPDQLGRVEVRFPCLGDRRRPGRAGLGDAVHAVRRRRPGPADPAGGGQPGGGRLRGRQPAPAVHRRGGLERHHAAAGRARRRRNNIRVLRTRSDSRLEFDDTAGAPKISITTRTGHEVVLDDGAQEITITHPNGCTIKLTASGSIDINANSR